MNKKLVVFSSLIFASVSSLFSCNVSIDSVTKTSILYGTMEFEGVAIKDDSHLRKISYDELNDMVTDKDNFLILVHNYSGLCSCWNDFHDSVLAPYIVSKNLLIYSIDYNELVNKEEENRFGLKIFSGHETLAIFNKGKLTYQKDNSDSKDTFTTRISGLASWLEERIYLPRTFLLSKAQLEKKYNQTNEFTIYFMRLSCGDCSYLDSTFLIDYNAKNQNMSPLYAINCDQEGIRTYNGAQPDERAEEGSDARNAYEQYYKFKLDFGLIESEANPAGWEAGRCFPCLFHINPEGNGKKTGDVIDSSAIFYNEQFEYNTGKILKSYFTAARLEKECLRYLKESSVEKKVIQDLVVEPYSEEKWGSVKGNYRHGVSAPLLEPIIKTFLDYNVGNN